MNRPLGLLLLPLRAPMLLVLLLISVYLGSHTTLSETSFTRDLPHFTTLAWWAECLQATVVVVVCTIPDVLLRQVSSLMASSRVISLVISLLLVTMGGLYMLHLEVLSVVLILGSAVLLARLDLVRIRVVPPPLLLTLALCLLVVGGLCLGRLLGPRLLPAVHEPLPAVLQQEGRRSAW
ncbi:MAG: hypothetical protein VKJ05_04965 [Synechococcaceae cyanobacterium]|nr:hypothetical protein [Synechococcaceae cyanobacterium]